MHQNLNQNQNIHVVVSDCVCVGGVCVCLCACLPPCVRTCMCASTLAGKRVCVRVCARLSMRVCVGTRCSISNILLGCSSCRSLRGTLHAVQTAPPCRRRKFKSVLHNLFTRYFNLACGPVTLVAAIFKVLLIFQIISTILFFQMRIMNNRADLLVWLTRYLL